MMVVTLHTWIASGKYKLLVWLLLANKPSNVLYEIHLSVNLHWGIYDVLLFIILVLTLSPGKLDKIGKKLSNKEFLSFYWS